MAYSTNPITYLKRGQSHCDCWSKTNYPRWSLQESAVSIAPLCGVGSANGTNSMSSPHFLQHPVSHPCFNLLRKNLTFSIIFHKPSGVSRWVCSERSMYSAGVVVMQLPRNGFRKFSQTLKPVQMFSTKLKLKLTVETLLKRVLPRASLGTE